MATLAVVIEGGHGEVFMQRFAAPLSALYAPRSLTPAAALADLGDAIAVGTGTRSWLAGLDPAFPIDETLPDARDALLLPPALRSLPPAPLDGRAPSGLKLPQARPA
ncbi:hypothetical protein AB5I41_16775 [Sphingomonas sp. MMS24-JH45]